MKSSNLKASLYLILSQYAFMGQLYIKNKYYFKGFDLSVYNNPPYKNQDFKDNITKIHNFLNNRHGKIYNKDYKTILEKAHNGDFVFLDPPYIENHNYSFKYNKDEKLSYDFLIELYNEVKKLDEKNIKWIMTQANTKDVKQIFEEYNITKYKVYRKLRKDNQHPYELIIRNF
jgi:DNA adenine methylase